jgi:hypothetical protein
MLCVRIIMMIVRYTCKTMYKIYVFYRKNKYIMVGIKILK